MELKDVEIDDFDAETVSEESAKERKKQKNRSGIQTALLVIGINILVLLVVIIGLSVYAFKAGVVTINTDKLAGKTSSDEDVPVYTEEEMQELLSKAQDDATALRETEVSEATASGYSLGRSELLDYIKDTLLTNNSSLETFRLLYPDYLVVVSNSKYNFLTIDRSLAQSTLVQDQLDTTSSDNGEYKYLDTDGNVISHKGIDVSEYQGKIDWSKVADDGVEFAIMRAYYRGYGTGRLVKDAKVEDNLQGAVDNGIHVGLYVFSQAINTDEAIEEAQSAIDTVSPYATNVPIIIDVERVAGANPRMDALSVDERTDVILAFCDTVSAAGYKPMIYFNTEMGALYVDLARLEDIPKWYAWYGDWLYFPYKYDIWQYKDTGSVNGISGNVDMNIALNAFWEE